MRISVAIPVHKMEGREYFLHKTLDILTLQTFKDFEVVITDNADDGVIENVCAGYPELHIRYFKNYRKGMAQNTNEAIKLSQGEIIKILYLDDFLAHEHALEEIDRMFRAEDRWLVTACTHFDYENGTEYSNDHYPVYNSQIHFGYNTIGSPSVLTIRNHKPLLFDENMTWLLDCDLYKRYFDAFGEPKILNVVNVVIGTGKHQATNILSDELKKSEHNYVIKKYETKRD